MRGQRGGRSRGLLPLIGMSSQLGIPRRVALLQSPLPLPQPTSFCYRQHRSSRTLQRTAACHRFPCLTRGVHFISWAEILRDSPWAEILQQLCPPMVGTILSGPYSVDDLLLELRLKIPLFLFLRLLLLLLLLFHDVPVLHSMGTVTVYRVSLWGCTTIPWHSFSPVSPKNSVSHAQFPQAQEALIDDLWYSFE